MLAAARRRPSRRHRTTLAAATSLMVVGATLTGLGGAAAAAEAVEDVDGVAVAEESVATPADPATPEPAATVEDTAPAEEVAPAEETAPDETVVAETAPDETVVDGALVDEAVPDDTVPAAEQGQPEPVAPVVRARGGAPLLAAPPIAFTAPVTTQDPTDQTVNSGETAVFTAAATGDPVPDVQWQVSRDGRLTWTDIVGATTTTLQVVTTDADDWSLYRAVFTNIDGQTVTADAQLTVVPDPATRPTVPNDVTAVQTGPGEITITWSAPDSPGTSPITHYSVGYSGGNWGNGEDVPPSTVELVFTGLDEGTYTASVAAYNANGTGPRVFLPVVVGPWAPQEPVDEDEDTDVEVVEVVADEVDPPATVSGGAELASTGAPAAAQLGLVALLVVTGTALVAVRRRLGTEA